MLNWTKDNLLEIVGVALAGLTYFEVGPDELVKALSGFAFVAYLVSGALIGWGACRAFYGFRSRSKRISRAEEERRDEELRADFMKCPYWIKVFFKGVMDKEAVFSESGSFYFDAYSEFILQFLDYKTVGENTLQFSMRKEAKRYFDEHAELLADVKDGDIKRHARRTDGAYVTYSLRDLNWWYYSDEDSMASATPASSDFYGIGL